MMVIHFVKPELSSCVYLTFMNFVSQMCYSAIKVLVIAAEF